MKFAFAGVGAWFLLFTEPVKAHINGSNSILQFMYDKVLQQEDDLPGATSSDNIFLQSMYNEELPREDYLPATSSDMPGLVWNDGRLLVKVIAEGDDAETLLAHTFEANGFQIVACNLYACEGYLPMINFPTLSADDNVQAIYPSMTMTQAGSKVSEALKSLKVDLVRANDTTLTGEGLSIGIMSDSFNKLNGYAADIESNDLPRDVVVLREFSGTNGTDEGRGMAQLVHDLIPGAKLFFRTAVEGQIDFANGIQELADANCSVIVDDIGKYYFKRVSCPCIQKFPTNVLPTVLLRLFVRSIFPGRSHCPVGK
jgi:hypothetical protein